jgi:hypothetical protein
MKTTKSFSAIIAALSLTAAAAGAQAATITNATTTVTDFGGFDWASNGTAVVDGFNATVVNDTFDLTYYAKATAILDPLGVAVFGLVGTPFEYTIRAVLNETSTCLSGLPGTCTNATFAVNSGSFQIWYDTTPDSNMVTGAGITDGVLILSGTIAAQPGGGFNVLTGGLATLDATVTFTNTTYINPQLTGSTATTTLQFGSSQTGWAAPVDTMPGAAGGTQALPANYLALQADANQNFTAAVPEPGTIALAGIALLGLGLARRGRKA